MRLLGIPLAVFGFWAVAVEPCSAAMLGVMVFVIMLPFEFARASKRVKATKSTVVYRTPRMKPEPKPPTREEQAADLRKDRDSAIKAAGFIPDEDERMSVVSEIEARFRHQMANLLR